MSFFEKIFGKLKSKSVEDLNSKKDSKDDEVCVGPVITIAREFGSGGREIAIEVAKKLGIKFYDKERIVNVAKDSGVDVELFNQIDEKSMDKFWFTVSKMAYDIPNDSDSFEQKVNNDKMFMIQSDTIRMLEKKGSAVFVGRCASYILKNSAIKVFISANFEDRVKRIVNRYNVKKDEAEKLIKVADEKREKYYDYYTNSKWNDVKNYDLVINVSDVGIDGAVEKICEYYNVHKQKIDIKQ